MNNWEGCRRKEAWPVLRYYKTICIEGLMRITEEFVKIADL
jgi:hypothetical protein